MRPKLLDLFCKAGGCSKGYHDAGFDVVGVDHDPQPHYPFAFVQADVFDFLSMDELAFDVIHASPPRQRYSRLRHLSKKVHPDLVGKTRDFLQRTGKYWIIENVVGAPLINPIQLCGSSFGLDLRRHRLFESNLPITGKPCDHSWQTPRFPANRSDRRKAGAMASVIVVVGYDTRKFNHLASVVSPHGGTQEAGGVAAWRRAMQIDWMTRDELSQAIPPAYCEFLGKQLIRLI